MPHLADLVQTYQYDPELGRRLVALVEGKGDMWFDLDDDDPDSNNYRCKQLRLGAHPELKEFEDKFGEIFEGAHTRYGSVVRSIATGDTGYTLIKYRSGDLCEMHVDLVPPEIRVCTGIYYINDDYEGGELVLPTQGLEMRPSPGEVVMVPATPDFPHEVRPVTSGNRYVVRCFYVCRVEDVAR
jgi:hypothetical protein